MAISARIFRARMTMLQRLKTAIEARFEQLASAVTIEKPAAQEYAADFGDMVHA